MSDDKEKIAALEAQVAALQARIDGEGGDGEGGDGERGDGEGGDGERGGGVPSKTTAQEALAHGADAEDDSECQPIEGPSRAMILAASGLALGVAFAIMLAIYLALATGFDRISGQAAEHLAPLVNRTKNKAPELAPPPATTSQHIPAPHIPAPGVTAPASPKPKPDPPKPNSAPAPRGEPALRAPGF